MQTPLRKSSAVSLTLEAFFFLLEQWWIRNPGEKKKNGAFALDGASSFYTFI